MSHIPQHIIVLNHAVPQLKMFVDTPAFFFQLGIFNFFVVKVNPGPFVLKITNNTTFGDPCHVGVVFSVDFFFKVLVVEFFKIVNGEDTVNFWGSLNLRRIKVTLVLKLPLKSLV